MSMEDAVRHARSPVWEECSMSGMSGEEGRGSPGRPKPTNMEQHLPINPAPVKHTGVLHTCVVSSLVFCHHMNSQTHNSCIIPDSLHAFLISLRTFQKSKHLFATIHDNAVVHQGGLAQKPGIRHFGEKKLWDNQNGTCLQCFLSHFGKF